MIRKSDSIAEITKALVAVQAEVCTVPKGGTNPHFRNSYSRMEDAVRCAQPSTARNGIAVTQWPTGDDSITTLLSHVSGEWIEGDFKIAPVKSDPQAKGSAITYGRRYAYLAALGLAPEDDDGSAASERPRQQPQQRTNGSSKPSNGSAPRPAANGDPGSLVLDFGKHKGKKLSEVPADYVQWLAGKARDEHVRKAAEQLSGSAGDDGFAPPPSQEFPAEQGGDTWGLSGDAAPPPSDDDIPF